MASETEQDGKLLLYLRMADEIQDQDPLVAYYCRSYAMEKGMNIPSMERTKNTNSILVSLKNQLEKNRKSIKLSPEDNLYVEAFASNILKKADKEYCAGQADQNTAETFYAAYVIFDIINHFGKLQPDIERKLKYSVEKVANIRRALKEERIPALGLLGGEPHLTVTIDTATTSTHDLIQNKSFFSTGLPSIDVPSPYFDDRKQLEIAKGSVVDVLVKWRKSHLRVKVNFDTDVVKDLGLKLLKLTKVKAETMKLLIPVTACKGSKLMNPFSVEHSSLKLQEISILEGKPVIMMGAFDDEIQELSQSNSKRDSRIIGFDEEEKRLRQRSIGISEYSPKLPKGSYIFCDFRTLRIPGIELNPPASEALKRMHTLACDPGIIAIMNKHHWRVGIMKEMAPLGYVGVSPKCVLGFNKNFGEEIALRLRTDDLKGFRKYESIKKTLLHELAHMVYSDHDASFYALDKQLNNEAITLDWTKSGSRTLNGTHTYTHYNDESYVQETYRNKSGQKLGGANLTPLSSARASAVVAAHNRYLSTSTNIKQELQIATQYIQEKDNLHESSISVEPDPDDSNLKYESDPGSIMVKYEPDPDDSITKDEPDPDDSIMKVEPDPYDSIMKDEPEPDDSIVKDEPDPDDRITKDKPESDDSIMKDDPDDSITKDGPDPDTIIKDEPDLDKSIAKDEPDPDDNILKDEPDPDPDPDESITKDEPDPRESLGKMVDYLKHGSYNAETIRGKSLLTVDDVMHVDYYAHSESLSYPKEVQSKTNDFVSDETGFSSKELDFDEYDSSKKMNIDELQTYEIPDSDDVKPGEIEHNCSMNLSENDELQRIEESVAIICQRLQKSIELLRFDSTQVDTSSTLYTLFKIIMNVIEHPGDEKFRKLRKRNPLFQKTVANHKAAMDVLRIVGFCEAVIMDEIGRSETYMVLKRNDPGLLWLAKSSLEVCFG